MKEAFILLLIFLTFLLMFSKTVRNYVRVHKEEVLAVCYTFMALWFSFVLLRPNNFKIVFKYMKQNILYSLYIVIYIAIPAYFIYTAYKSYIDLINKYKEKTKVKQVKKNHKS